MLFKPTTVDNVLKPLRLALDSLHAVAEHQDASAEKSIRRLELAASVYAESKAREEYATETATAEAERARRLVVKFEGLLY